MPLARLMTCDGCGRRRAILLDLLVALGRARPRCGCGGHFWGTASSAIMIDDPRPLGVVSSTRPDSHLGGVRA